MDNEYIIFILCVVLIATSFISIHNKTKYTSLKSKVNEYCYSYDITKDTIKCLKLYDIEN